MLDGAICPDEFRAVMGSFPTGVTVITAMDKRGRPWGVTVNSFGSVSLDPPLVLWSLKLSSKSYPAFLNADRFSVSILAEDQATISSRFATHVDDKFDGICVRAGLDGVPLINGAAAHIECRKVTSHPGGDHRIFLGEVERIAISERRPLIFSRGKYMTARPFDDDDIGVIVDRERQNGRATGTALETRP